MFHVRHLQEGIICVMCHRVMYGTYRMCPDGTLRKVSYVCVYAALAPAVN